MDTPHNDVFQILLKFHEKYYEKRKIEKGMAGVCQEKCVSFFIIFGVREIRTPGGLKQTSMLSAFSMIGNVYC